MIWLEWNMRFAGLLLMLLGLAHIPMPRYFKWKEECEALTPLTREIHFVHHAYIGFICLLNGVLCAGFAPDLIARSPLSRDLLIGLGIFWGSRLIVQVFVYSPAHWRGKRFETVTHVLFTLFWLYLAATFFGTQAVLSHVA
ncbi:MAG TPA: hypothetical protein VG944_21635 [Fimbriimonas sp.]|nr:hypothetical protein [Fimbriimonas sp.]